MSCIEGLVRDRAADGQARLKQALGVFLLGGVVRGYLPQTWVIMTEQESITIHADTQGNIRVLQGIAPTRDGDIKIGHNLLADGIRNGRSLPPGSCSEQEVLGRDRRVGTRHGTTQAYNTREGHQIDGWREISILVD